MSDFEKKKTKLVAADDWNGVFGIQKGTRYHTRAGVSSLYSEVYFLSEVEDEDLMELPDYVLSETLQSDVDSSVSVCAWHLVELGYLHKDTNIVTKMGAISEGQREGVNVSGWQDFKLRGQHGQPIYTQKTLSDARLAGQCELAFALGLLVRDICEQGGFLSRDWYFARIVEEYFKNKKLSRNSAYLIGELFKELCLKEQHEGDLKNYYLNLRKAQADRDKGSRKNADKAEELRQFCVGLCAKLIVEESAGWAMAQDEVRAEELRNAALRVRPDDFTRAGKPYSKEWFLRHIIEDRRLQIVEAVKEHQRKNS